MCSCKLFVINNVLCSVDEVVVYLCEFGFIVIGEDVVISV